MNVQATFITIGILYTCKQEGKYQHLRDGVEGDLLPVVTLLVFYIPE